LLQLVDKLATSVANTHLVDKLWDFYVCRIKSTWYILYLGFLCLFPACWQVVNGLLTTCYKVFELNRLVISSSNNLLSSCNSTICQQVEWQPCSNFVK
jgi:hypothetical protein